MATAGAYTIDDSQLSGLLGAVLGKEVDSTNHAWNFNS